MKTKVCPVCGKIFEPDTFRHTYCSQECRVNSKNQVPIKSEEPKKETQEKEPFRNPINLAPKEWRKKSLFEERKFKELAQAVLNGGIRSSSFK